MVRTKEIARLTTGWALGLYPSKKLITKASKAYKCALSPPFIEDPESALGPYPSKTLKTKATKTPKCASSSPHIEDPESAFKEDDVDDICSPTKSGDIANSTVESLEARIPKLEEHTQPVDNADLDMGTAVSPAESNDELSDNDSSPAESNEELSDNDSSQAESNEKFIDDEYKPKIYPKKQRTKTDDDEYLPSTSVLERLFNICPRPKKQRTKKKQVKKKGKKENDLVGLDLSGHGGWQRKIRKKQITKNDTMAEPVSTWCQPQAKLPSHPIIENFLRGPQERFICKDFKSYADARTFAEKHFQIGSSQNGYSAVGTAGRDPRAFIEIQKKRCAFEIDTEHRTVVRDEVTKLRRRPDLAKAVSGTSVTPACIASKPFAVLALSAVTRVSK